MTCSPAVRCSGQAVSTAYPIGRHHAATHTSHRFRPPWVGRRHSSAVRTSTNSDTTRRRAYAPRPSKPKLAAKTRASTPCNQADPAPCASLGGGCARVMTGTSMAPMPMTSAAGNPSSTTLLPTACWPGRAAMNTPRMPNPSPTGTHASVGGVGRGLRFARARLTTNCSKTTSSATQHSWAATHCSRHAKSASPSGQAAHHASCHRAGVRPIVLRGMKVNRNPAMKQPTKPCTCTSA